MPPRIATALLVVFFATSCGALKTPVSVEPRTAADERPEGALEVDVVEGRSNGLVLRLAMREPLESARTLELFRSVGDGDAVSYQAIELQERIRNALVDTGVQFVDQDMRVGAHYRYVLVAFDDDGELVGDSVPLEVSWQQPPPRPDDFVARAVSATVAEVGWAWEGRFGATVFRRDVLDRSARLERVADLEPAALGIWVDRDVGTGRVYSYRIALAVPNDGWMQFGPPSEERYVTIPAAAAAPGDD